MSNKVEVYEINGIKHLRFIDTDGKQIELKTDDISHIRKDGKIFAVSKNFNFIKSWAE